jgi:hypothetical protein
MTFPDIEQSVKHPHRPKKSKIVDSHTPKLLTPLPLQSRQRFKPSRTSKVTIQLFAAEVSFSSDSLHGYELLFPVLISHLWVIDPVISTTCIMFTVYPSLTNTTQWLA